MKHQFNPFKVEYEKIDESIYDFKSECIMAAHNAMSKNIKNLPIIVMMSGGIDSELVAESLLLAGIPFTCVIGRLQNETEEGTIIFNKHDYEYAERWCNLNNVDIVYCDIDVFEQDKLLIEYALSAKSFSPQFACSMYMIKWCSDQGYFFMAGHGEPTIVLVDDEYFMMDEQREYALNNFCELNNCPGVIKPWRQKWTHNFGIPSITDC